MFAPRSLGMLAIAVTLGAPVIARSGAQATDETKRVQDAVTVLETLTGNPDDRIPQQLLERAEGIVVIPSLIKGGFIVGAKHGSGIVSARDRATMAWSAPAFIHMTGGSIGWQIGVESVDLVLLVMKPDAIDQLLADKFTIGANLSLAAGPVGRSGDAAVNLEATAPVLAYSRSKGLFAGATFEGSAIHGDEASNKAFYGTTQGMQELIRRTPNRSTLPPAASSWIATLARLTASAERASARGR